MTTQDTGETVILVVYALEQARFKRMLIIPRTQRSELYQTYLNNYRLKLEF